MLFLALKHLFSRKKQFLLSLLGVALGTAVFITFTSIMSGFQEYLIDRLVNTDAHVRIEAEDRVLTSSELKSVLFPDPRHFIWVSAPLGHQVSRSISNPVGWFDRLSRDERVFAFSPQLNAPVLFFHVGISRAGNLNGIRPATQEKVTNIKDYVIKGSLNSLGNASHRVILGSKLAEKLGAIMGDTILISAGGKSPLPFQVGGLFETGAINVDEAVAYANINDVQQLSGRQSQISDIVVRLFDVTNAAEFATTYALLGREKVLSWDQANANILSVFALQNMIRSFISIAIMVVASFGIYNILNILVNQKRRDIGILRSMGFDSHEILRLFLIQGIILGVLGGVVGMGIGFGLSNVFNSLKVEGPMGRTSVSFAPSIYLLGFAVASLSAIISSALPARAASKLEPIDVIRSGD